MGGLPPQMPSWMYGHQHAAAAGPMGGHPGDMTHPGQHAAHLQDVKPDYMKYEQQVKHEYPGAAAAIKHEYPPHSMHSQHQQQGRSVCQLVANT